MSDENIEQQTTPDDALPSRDELIAAVREAGGAESVDVAAEAAAAGQPPPQKPADVPSADAGGEADEPAIAAKLRAREKAFAERQEAESYVAQLRAKAEAEREAILAEARAKAEAEHKAFLESQRRSWKENPTEHLRSLGTPDEIVDAVMREGTPEGRAFAALQRELAEAKKAAAEASTVKSEFEKWKTEQHQAKQQAQVAQIREQFFGQFATKEAAPYLHARYEPDEIFERATAIARDWTKAGVAFADSDIVEYLEHQSRKRLSGIAPQQVSGAAAGEAAGKRPPGQATGTRTLSAAAGSERRTSPKPLAEMTEAEQRQALIDEVANARRSLKDQTP